MALRKAPLLQLSDDYHLVGGSIVLEFINDAFAQPDMLGGDAFQRAEVRRLTQLFAEDFWTDVTAPLYTEKVVKPQERRLGLSSASTDSRAVKAGLDNLNSYALYIGALFDERRWLAGDLFSIADAMAAAQVSLLDLMGVVPWKELSTTVPSFKAWYARVKSRPAFRAIIDDVLPDIQRPVHYADPDF